MPPPENTDSPKTGTAISYLKKRPGTPARFYGANVCFSANYMDHALSDRLADEFAAIGYNLIRLHHFDRDTCDRSGGTSTRMKAEFKAEWII